jgi:hypothetical protein
MPYKPKAEKERELYLTLAELCAGISSLENCSEADALAQVCMALADDMLICRWDDEGYIHADWGKYWLKARIRIPGDGKVLDNQSPFQSRSRWRTLLILRASASTIWPLPPAPIEGAIAPPAASPAKREAIPPSPTSDWQTEFRPWYRETYIPQQEKAGRVPKRDEDVKAAQKAFPKVPREEVYKARRDLAPAAWTKPGPKPKKK